MDGLIVPTATNYLQADQSNALPTHCYSQGYGSRIQYPVPYAESKLSAEKPLRSACPTTE